MNEINLNLEYDENSLSFYIKNLTKIYNATLSQFEANDSSSDLTVNKNTNESFKQCKEKAFEYLIKAKSLDNILTNQSSQSECLQQTKDIDEIVNKYQANRQSYLNYLTNLHKEYEIGFSLIKQKRISNASDFSNQSYLDDLLKRLISGNNSFASLESKPNVLFYGASGCGKMSWIIDFMLKNKLVTLAENEEKCAYKKVKPFIIDFKCVLENFDSNTEIIEDIIKSINLFVNKESMHALIILKNVELLFLTELNERHTQLKNRFVCNLIVHYS